MNLSNTVFLPAGLQPFRSRYLLGLIHMALLQETTGQKSTDDVPTVEQALRISDNQTCYILRYCRLWCTAVMGTASISLRKLRHDLIIHDAEPKAYKRTCHYIFAASKHNNIVYLCIVLLRLVDLPNRKIPPTRELSRNIVTDCLLP